MMEPSATVRVVVVSGVDVVVESEAVVVSPVVVDEGTFTMIAPSRQTI